MILHIENPKDATRKLLELIKEFVKVAGYKFIYRNLLDPYILTTKDKKKKSREQSHSQFQQQQQQKKTVEVKNLFSENYEMLVIRTEDDTNR